ncbi:hypothetical protein [Arthrobacter sp. RT-1]|uniref:hypothetical protein n=1 Tax=Arthrobacter sp. RT-1 TaxID=2292263 RepID=UPI002162EBEC|nr:hypothetical protein [Arthrobacter sp. RT-1]
MKLADGYSALLLGVVLVVTAGACNSSPREEPESGQQPPCFPPAYSVSPTIAKPGATVTVAAPAADCNPQYGSNAQVQVSVTDQSGAEVISARAPMTDAGEFTFTFTVPEESAVGEAIVTAMPHDIDWCDDTGKNNRATGIPQLELVSCATPVETFTITR